MGVYAAAGTTEDCRIVIDCVKYDVELLPSSLGVHVPFLSSLPDASNGGAN